jgi:hypothetical protein
MYIYNVYVCNEHFLRHAPPGISYRRGKMVLSLSNTYIAISVMRMRDRTLREP